MTLRLNGDNSGFTEIKAPNNAGDNSITLPASNGSAYQLLRNGTSAGELTYESDLRVDGTGNVGIGRDPVYSGVFGGSHRILHIGGTAAPGIRITSDTANQADFIIQAGNSGRATYIASLAENGDIAYFTRPTGGSLTERFRIKGAGQIALSAGCPGIDFSGIQTNAAGMDSETLNGYETGTWTPTVGGHSGMGTITYSSDGTYGRYIRVGHYVTIMGQVTVTNVSSSPTGNFRIRGLPFAPVNNDAINRGIGAIATKNGGVDYVHLCIRGAFTDGNGLVGTAVTMKQSQTDDNGMFEPSSATFITNSFIARFSLTYKMV